MNFVSKDKGSVERINGKVVRAIMLINGDKIPFILKNGKPVREDYHPNQPRFEMTDEEYKKFNKQLFGLFGTKNSLKKKMTTKKSAAAMTVPDVKKTKETVLISKHNKDLAKPLIFTPVDKKEREWFDKLNTCGIKPYSHGWLGIRSWYKSGEKIQVNFIKVPDIFTAVRMINHTIESYQIDLPDEQAEISKLKDIKMILGQINQLIVDWANNKGRRIEIQKKLITVADELSFCRNEFKMNIKEKTEESTEIKDQSGRINPGATATKIISALNSLEQRINQINKILPKLFPRLETLEQEEERMRNALKITRTGFTNLINNQIFQGKEINKKRLEIFEKGINVVLHNLNLVFFSPYWEISEDTKKSATKVKELLRIKKDAEAFQIMLSIISNLTMSIKVKAEITKENLKNNSKMHNFFKPGEIGLTKHFAKLDQCLKDMPTNCQLKTDNENKSAIYKLIGGAICLYGDATNQEKICSLCNKPHTHTKVCVKNN